MEIRADSTFTVSPPNSTPSLSQTSSVDIFTDSACYTVSYLVSSCISASPGFTTLEPSLQASCLCYSSTFFDPSLFDGPATTCAQFLSTAAPQSLSDIAPFTGFCTSIGVGNPISTTSATTSESIQAATSSIPLQSSETSIGGSAPTTVSNNNGAVPTYTTSPSPISARPPQGKSNPEIFNLALTIKDLTIAQEIGIAVGSLVVALIAGYGSVLQPNSHSLTLIHVKDSTQAYLRDSNPKMQLGKEQATKRKYLAMKMHRVPIWPCRRKTDL